MKEMVFSPSEREKKMYSPVSSTTVRSENYSHHNSTDLDQTLIGESIFGQQHFKGFTGHLQSAISMNLNYSAQQNHMQENYTVHQIHDFAAHRSLMIKHETFYHQTPPEQNMQHLIQGFGDPVIQQPQLQPQLRPVQPQRVGEEVLVVELERPLFEKGKPRLRWTEELHARFLHAVSELDGLFSATPNAILRRMNVRGVTVDHIKSHLQKVRIRHQSDISAQNIVHPGIQHNNADSHPPQLSGQGSSTSRSTAPVNGFGVIEAETGEYGRLLRSSETPPSKRQKTDGSSF